MKNAYQQLLSLQRHHEFATKEIQEAIKAVNSEIGALNRVVQDKDERIKDLERQLAEAHGHDTPLPADRDHGHELHLTTP